jgi:NAD(P)-dependent dehydrogenase (short-subunit alcohol dehydrogenase family)
MTSDLYAQGQTIVLTGGTSGLGYFCARTIASAHPDWHLVLASRHQSSAIRAINALKRATGNQQIEWVPLDLASLASIRTFASAFAARSLPPLHAVICNAGLQIVSGTTYTADGFEMTFGVNCLGHFLLVNLLLHHLVAPARIVFVSSTRHDSDRPKTFMTRLMGLVPPCYSDARALAWPERYPESDKPNESPRIVGMRRYATSKLCDVFYAYELARRLQAQGYSTPEHPLTVNAYNPGTTPGTGLARDASPIGRFSWTVVLPLLLHLFPGLTSQQTAGQALARLVLDPGLQNVTGKYFERMQERPSSRESYDREKAVQLWETSASLVNLRPDETIFVPSQGNG